MDVYSKYLTATEAAKVTEHALMSININDKVFYVGVDIVTEERHETSVDLSELEIEEGQSVTGFVRTKRPTLSLTCIISNSFTKYVDAINKDSIGAMDIMISDGYKKKAANGVPMFQYSEAFYRYMAIDTAVTHNLMFTIRTRLGYLHNMMGVSLTTTNNASTSNFIKFSLSFKQVQFVPSLFGESKNLSRKRTFLHKEKSSKSKALERVLEATLPPKEYILIKTIISCLDIVGTRRTPLKWIMKAAAHYTQGTKDNPDFTCTQIKEKYKASLDAKQKKAYEDATHTKLEEVKTKPPKKKTGK